jgi:hypothetical protein
MPRFATATAVRQTLRHEHTNTRYRFLRVDSAQLDRLRGCRRHRGPTPGRSRSPMHVAAEELRTPSNLTSNAHPGPIGTGPEVASIGRIRPVDDACGRGGARSAISAVSAATPRSDQTTTKRHPVALANAPIRQSLTQPHPRHRLTTLGLERDLLSAPAHRVRPTLVAPGSSVIATAVGGGGMAGSATAAMQPVAALYSQ